MTRSHQHPLLAIFLIALALRLAVTLVHPITDLPDSRDYDTLARAMLHHQPYALTDIWGQRVIASRMPGYPAFIAAVYGCVGEHPLAVLMVQACMGAGCVWLVFVLGSYGVWSVHTGPLRTAQWTRGTPTAGTWHAPAMVGLVAAVLVALDPLGVLFSAALLSETVFTLVLLALVVLSVKMAEGRISLGVLVAVGALAAVAVYMRASCLWLVIFMPALALVAWPRRAVVALAVTVAAVILALAPWQIRNHGAIGTGWLRLTTLEGISLYEAVYPQATGGPLQDKIALPQEFRSLNEAQRDAEWNRRAWAYMRQDPARIARLAVVKLGRTWSPWLNAAEYRSPVVNVLLTLWHVPIYILALLGLWRVARRSGASGEAGMTPGMPRALSTWTRPTAVMPAAAIWALPIIYFSLVHCLFLGSVRYRVPLMPLVYLFAAHGVVWLLAKFQSPSEITNSTLSK